jgi:hypothetical protein
MSEALKIVRVLFDYESGAVDLASLPDRKIISVWIDEKGRTLYPREKWE